MLFSQLSKDKPVFVCLCVSYPSLSEVDVSGNLLDSECRVFLS